MKIGILVLLMLATAILTAGEPIDSSSEIRVFADFKLYQEFDMPRYEKNYLESLNFKETEIVESALAQVTMLKLAQPLAQWKRLQKKVEELALRGETAGVRYKAYLASEVFSNPEMFQEETLGRYDSSAELFVALGQRLAQGALAAHER